MPSSPQGERYEIHAGGYRAVIAQVGAALADLTLDSGEQLVLPTPWDVIRRGQAGATLAPWANRIDHGRYRFEDVDYQLSISEPARDNAIHGLVHWERWTVAESADDRLVLSFDLVPTPGYPFALRLENTYTVGAEGLTWTVRATNLGQTAAPYGMALHPYVVPPRHEIVPGSVDHWTLKFPSSLHGIVNDRLIPVSFQPVDGSEFDFHEGRSLAARELDDVFELSGPRVELVGDDGAATILTFVEGANWLQVYTDGDQRRAVALEPQTAPADAFNSGRGVIVLRAGEEHTTRVNIRALPAAT